MSTEANKALMRRFYEEIFNKGNLSALDELIAVDFVDHNPEPGQGAGLAGVKEGFAQFFAAFGDFQVKVEDMIAEGDKVAVRAVMQGTHKGEFAGIPATGKRFSVGLIDIVRFSGGYAVERWGQYDQVGMMQQLGVLPSPGK